MSYIFDVADETVWSPATRVGQLYVGTLDAVAATLKAPTGLTTDSGDLYDIDLAEFGALVEKMLATYATSDHPYLRMLLQGVLPISIAILERGGGSIAPATQREQDYVAKVHAMDLPMA